MKPLVYVAVFVALSSVTLIMWIFVLWEYERAFQCVTYPSFWCWDDWVCEEPCPNNTQSPCFDDATSPSSGLLSCLIGLPSQTCGDGVACVCDMPLEDTDNCFQGCPQSLQGAVCPTAKT